MKTQLLKNTNLPGNDSIIYATGTGLFSGLTIAILFNNPLIILPVIGTGMAIGFAKCSKQNQLELNNFLFENQHLIK
jgi:hypothetical protein